MRKVMKSKNLSARDYYMLKVAFNDGRANRRTNVNVNFKRGSDND